MVTHTFSRDDAIELVRDHLRSQSKKPTYYAEPFAPHEWVLDCLAIAYAHGRQSVARTSNLDEEGRKAWDRLIRVNNNSDKTFADTLNRLIDEELRRQTEEAEAPKTDTQRYTYLHQEVTNLYAAGAPSFTTCESGGGQGFQVRHKFQTLTELQAYYRAWIELMVSESERQQEVLHG